MIIHRFPGADALKKPTFESVYEDYYQAILRYLLKHIGNMPDAEDLAAETFLYCYQNYDSYDPAKSSVPTWLYLVAGSRLKNYYRDKKEHVEISELEERLFVEESDMERAAWLEELRSMLAEKLKRLPERQQKAVVMRYFQDKEYDEIASALDTTPGNVRVMLSRTLDKLEQELAGMKDDWSV